MSDQDPKVILLYLKGDSSEQPIGTATITKSPLFGRFAAKITLAAEFNSSGVFDELQQSPLHFDKEPVVMRLVLRDNVSKEPIGSIERLREIDLRERAKKNNL